MGVRFHMFGVPKLCLLPCKRSTIMHSSSKILYLDTIQIKISVFYDYNVLIGNPKKTNPPLTSLVQLENTKKI